ncbi:unnamed protein product [Leptidea sinapis]|uniref:Uncharacterized protein n=1 Tax=Leptidea sinapis TaxID=189913 RepID=A0A5E4QBC7_9NEOP|nr:unnamed protein product [Leptidea sinapis]
MTISPRQLLYSEENTITPKRLNLTEDKPIGRARKNFKFQPNSNDAIEVEKFRTSVDVISCEKNKLAGTTSSPDSGNINFAGKIVLGSVITILALI